jgi:hypothetical protein
MTPCTKDRKEKGYTENVGEDISWEETIWKAEDDITINLREYSVTMVGMLSGMLYLPPASFLAASRALFTACLCLAYSLTLKMEANCSSKTSGFSNYMVL